MAARDTNDGSCDADCSLREAIRAANTAPGADTITLPAGTYQITMAGADDVAALGDFDITDSVSISGAGAATTIVDGRDLDRVFDIAPVTRCGCTVAFAGLTVTNGSANAANFNAGGAIFFRDNVTEAAVGSLSASFNRIDGNSAAAGSGLFVASGLAGAGNSWWGCNAGPVAAPCGRVVGPADIEPWLVLSIYTAGGTAGAGSASATVDAQTVTTSITVDSLSRLYLPLLRR